MCSFIYSMLCALRCAIDLFVLNIPASTEISTYCHSLSRHDALPIWGWWSDVCPGAALTLRDATQADIERCTLRDNASRNTADWLCELGDRGSLVSRKAIAKLTVIESQAGLSRSVEHTSELQSLMRTSYAVFSLQQNNHSTYVY